MPRWLAGVALVLTVYFPAAWVASRAYVDPAPSANAAQILGPFVWADGFAWWVTSPRPDGNFVLYEDARRLERTDDFQALSAVPGRVLHDGPRLLFSVRGNPNSNGHHYWGVPSPQVPSPAPALPPTASADR